MNHSVTFITTGQWHPTRPYRQDVLYNTWEDWKILPTSRPVIQAPKPITEYLDTYTYDGILDFTETLPGSPFYEYSEGSFEFIVLNETIDVHTLFSIILDRIHGQYVRIILEDDPAVYYEGRVEVSDLKVDKHWSYITISYSLNPLKKLIELDVHTQ